MIENCFFDVALFNVILHDNSESTFCYQSLLRLDIKPYKPKIRVHGNKTLISLWTIRSKYMYFVSILCLLSHLKNNFVHACLLVLFTQ
jgi:hypothetical protein